MNGEAIQNLREIIEDAVVGKFGTTEIYGIPHSVRALNPVLPPMPVPLKLHTLTGFVDYAKTRAAGELGDSDSASLAAHVVSPSLVRLVGNLDDTTRLREVLAEAEFVSLLGQATPFRFGAYMELEAFNIALQALFQESPTRTKLLAVLGNIKDENVTQAGDDGVTQTVTAKAGIAVVTNLEIPNPVDLIPFRTFREVSQPHSPFVLRLKRVPGDLPQAALFEADGGQWQLVAMERVAAFLRHADGFPEAIPVIA